VKTHLLRLFAKLDVNDRTRAVVVAMERGLRRNPSGTGDSGRWLRNADEELRHLQEP
jgi:hypothetical protein